MKPFITSNSGNGQYYVTVKVSSIEELHDAHDTVLAAFATPSPASRELASLVESINYRVNNPSAWPVGFDEEASELFRLAASQLAAVAAERDALREALKPSGETKAEYIGEFTIAVERFVNDDEEPDDETEGTRDPYEHITVPWTTIKEIMAAIFARAVRSTLSPGGSNGQG